MRKLTQLEILAIAVVVVSTLLALGFFLGC